MTVSFSNLGPFLILNLLGSGTFAQVYRALDERTQQVVALKVLHASMLDNPDFVTRFLREGTVMEKLRHPHIVPVFETGQVQGRSYIAMALIEGRTLAALIQDRGAVPFDEALALLKPLCEALDYTHAQQIIHRDLKPANILLDARGTPYLSDFGVVRLISEETIASTMSRGLFGTLQYLAPEVWHESAASHQTDIYALGCIAYEILTGVPLVAKGSFVYVMQVHLRGPELPSSWPHGGPPTTSAVFKKVLAKKPSQRFSSAMAFWEALARQAQAKQPSKRGAPARRPQRPATLQPPTLVPDRAPPALAHLVSAEGLPGRGERFVSPEPVLRLEVSQSAVTLSYDDGEGDEAVFSGPNQLDPVVLTALEHDLEAYGRALFAGVVHHTPDEGAPATSSTAAGYAFAQTRSGGRMQVRLALDPNTPHLHLLRWEALLPTGDDTFLALREGTSLARHLAPSARPAPPPARLRILAAIASPITLGRPGNRLLEPLAPFDIAAERAILTAEQALPRLLGAGVAEYSILERLGGRPVTLAAIREAVQQGYSVLHLVCHGLFVDDDYYLLLEGPDGTHDFVPAAELAQAVSGHGLRLVVLAACQSAVSGAGDGLQGIEHLLALAGVPAVIIMQERLALEAAQLFTQLFYDGLTRSGRPDMALVATRLALFQSGQGRAWSVPTLFAGAGDSRLFEVDLEQAGAMEALQPPEETGRGGLSLEALQSALASLVTNPVPGDPETPAPQDRQFLSALIKGPVRIDPAALRDTVEAYAKGPGLRLPALTYRQIAAALSGGKPLILIGPPGTAKTILAEAICRFAAYSQMSAGTVSTTATADWSAFDTIGGYMVSAQGQLVFRPSRLLEALGTGRWLIINEINRANVDKAFGELLTVLDGQSVELPYNVGAHPVRILPPSPNPTPERWWPDGPLGPYDYVLHPSWRLIGTINVYDKSSLFSLSLAFIRRFAFIDIDLPDGAGSALWR